MTRRWKIVLGVAIALLVLRVALPTILARVIEGQASAALGRAVEVKNVDLFLLAGRVTLEELLVGPPLGPEAATAPIDPGTALIHWPHVLVDVGWLGLFAGELRVQRVEVVEARERLVLQADDRLEPLVVARPEDSEPPSEAPEPPPSEEAGELPPPEEGEQGGGWPLVLEQVVLTDHAFFLVDAADPAEPPLEFSLTELTLMDVVLVGGQVSVGPVGLRGPRLRVRRDLQIAAAPAAESEEPEAPPAREAPAAEAAGAAPSDFRIASFAIEDAQLGLLLEEGEFEVTLHLSVHDATLARNVRFPVELRLSREEGWLEVAGDLGLAPIAFAGIVRWEDFPIVGLIAAASPEIPLALHAGSVAGDLKIDLENAGGAEPGRASVRGRISAKELVADEIEIPLQSDEPPKVALASVRIEKPAVKLVRRASAAGEETGEPLGEERPPTTEEPAPASGGPRIAVGKLEVTGGSFQLIDESVEPVAGITLSEIRLEGSKLRHPSRDGRLEAELRSLAGLSLKVSGDWQAGAGTTTVALRNLPLPSYSPYLAKAAGFEFKRGSLSLDGEIESAGPTHEVKADLTLEEIALENVEEGGFENTFGMSAPLAVSLLTDAQGNIGLPVNLTLDEGGTAIDVAALLIGALRQSLGAVLAAPLKGLGLALRVATGSGEEGAGGMELDPVELEPGSARLAPDQVDHAGLVANGLSARPDIGLVLMGRVSEEDEPFLRAQALLERIEAGGFAPYDERDLLERRRLRRGVERRVRLQPDELDPEDAALIGEWLEEMDVSGEARDRLARARADAARSVLADTHGTNPAQVRIGEPQEGPPGVAIELFVTAQ
jgi:hypothetical protein